MFRFVHRAALVAGVTSLMFAAPAHAQWSPSIVVKAGATLPLGVFGDVVGTGYNIGAGLELSPRLSPVGLRFEFDFHENEVDGFSDLDFRTVAGIGNLVFQAPASSIYVIGGLGLYKGYIPDSGDDSETKAGVNGGIGIRIPLTGFSTFIEARYHHIFTESATQMIPISFGVRF